MNFLVKPTDSAQDVFLMCISNYTDVSLKIRLISVQSTIQFQSDQFECCITSNTLHTMTSQADINGIVTVSEMKKGIIWSL